MERPLRDFIVGTEYFIIFTDYYCHSTVLSLKNCRNNIISSQIFYSTVRIFIRF